MCCLGTLRAPLRQSLFLPHAQGGAQSILWTGFPHGSAFDSENVVYSMDDAATASYIIRATWVFWTGRRGGARLRPRVIVVLPPSPNLALRFSSGFDSYLERTTLELVAVIGKQETRRPALCH